MKNSWIPLMMMPISLLVAFTLVGSNENQGFTGPQIHPGIFAKNEAYIPAAGSDQLDVNVAVSDDSTLQWGMDEPRDERIAFEFIAWDDISIVLEDDHALSRTFAKALGEHLSGFIAHHGGSSPVSEKYGARLILMVPRGAQILPLTGRRIIRIKHVGADIERSQEGIYTLQVSLEDALRSEAGMSGLLPANGIKERRLRIDVGPTLVNPSQQVPWPQWHTAVGRAMAAGMLEELFNDDPLLVWHEADDTVEATAERHASGLNIKVVGEEGHQTLELHPLDWSDTLQPAPDAKVGRWFMGWQTPFVRGWTGAIVGTDRFNSRTGDDDATIDLFEKNLSKGGWSPTDSSTDDMRRWDGSNRDVFELFHADRRPFGWQLLTWQRNPHAGAMHAAWIDAAYKQNPVARRQLARHLLAAAVPENQQISARDYLRQDPDVAELALLGMRPDANAEEQAVLQWSRWIRGVINEIPAGVPPSQAIIHAEQAWDGRARLFAQHSDQTNPTYGFVQADQRGVMWMIRDGETTTYRRLPVGEALTLASGQIYRVTHVPSASDDAPPSFLFNRDS